MPSGRHPAGEGSAQLGMLPGAASVPCSSVCWVSLKDTFRDGSCPPARQHKKFISMRRSKNSTLDRPSSVLQVQHSSSRVIR